MSFPHRVLTSPLPPCEDLSCSELSASKLLPARRPPCKFRIWEARFGCIIIKLLVAAKFVQAACWSRPSLPNERMTSLSSSGSVPALDLSKARELSGTHGSGEHCPSYTSSILMCWGGLPLSWMLHIISMPRSRFLTHRSVSNSGSVIRFCSISARSFARAPTVHQRPLISWRELLLTFIITHASYSSRLSVINSLQPKAFTREAATLQDIFSCGVVTIGVPDHRMSHPVVCALH
mmetsp:Transcript_40041/g.125832  ORF Transcript_40041/g.125832 Transcript_40041/m.125832 type:complete len:235 (-) Transcript_40041:716-1420(-)